MGQLPKLWETGAGLTGVAGLAFGPCVHHLRLTALGRNKLSAIVCRYAITKSREGFSGGKVGRRNTLGRESSRDCFY